MSLPNKVNIAYVVPTKDRPDDLRILFTSLQKQTRQPDQIIIVDGSDPPIEPICHEYPDLDISYVRCFPPSLAKQRNAGMAALDDSITVAGYLDDDLELEADATQKMVDFWMQADDQIGGVSMSIINQSAPYRKNWLKFFLMYGDPAGSVTGSGFHSAIPTVTETIETKWLYGGATLWHRNVIAKFEYDEWFVGHGFGEDFEYSYRVGRDYKLFVLAGSRTYHHERPMADEKMYILGRQQTYNRFYMFRKMGDFSSLLFAWSISGLVFMNFLALVKNPGRPTRDRLKGNLRGIWEALIDGKKSFAGHWK
ncbi:glycosyltransferase family 2 protein [Kiloniella antarctica]|uniref:Glycosyltransferase family 2 protein n=1 Tax=Kiloniella antarctica TaxID=1550907 RepID=A0ABW5BMN7_9PROT